MEPVTDDAQKPIALQGRVLDPVPKDVVLTGLAAILVIAVVLLIAYVVDDVDAYIFWDPASMLGVSPMMGAMSALGIMLWAAAAAVAWFAAFVLEGRDRSFLMALGTLSVVLALDDQFMLHEGLADEKSTVGQLVYLAVYGGVALGIGIVWRRSFAGPHLGLLVAALAMLGLSLGADTVAQLLGQNSGMQAAVEDSFKFLGIAYWAAFIAMRAHYLVTSQRQPASPVDATASSLGPVITKG